MIHLLGFEFLSICMISRACEHALLAKEMNLLHKWELNYLSTLFAFISCSFILITKLLIIFDLCYQCYFLISIMLLLSLV